MRSSGGDGIYIGRSQESGSAFYCENIYIKDITLEDHHRQGISIISAQDLLIENVTITGTAGTPPQAGIDFEPNNRKERLIRCLIKNCTIESNRGPGILFYLGTLDADSEPISVRVEDSRIRWNGVSLWLGGVKENPPGSIIFSGNKFGLIKRIKQSRNLDIAFVQRNDQGVETIE